MRKNELRSSGELRGAVLRWRPLNVRRIRMKGGNNKNEIYENARNRQRLCIHGLHERASGESGEIARLVSDRHKGIGSDGLF